MSSAFLGKWLFHAVVLVVALCMSGVPTSAQTVDDEGFVTRILQTLLSRGGSNVGIHGLSGVARGPVTIERITATDHLGEWLTIRNLTIDWDRTAMFRSNVVFRDIRADEVIIHRKPEEKDQKFPSVEARGFRLPELPLSFRISELAFPNVIASGSAFDEPAEMEVRGSISLADGNGSLVLEAARTDGRSDFLDIEASYDNSSETLKVDARVQEAQGGTVSKMLKLPGAPSIDLKIKGGGASGNADITLDLLTNGVERLGGFFRVTAQVDGSKDFELNLGGDVRPLFAEDFREFFGEEGQVRIVGNRRPDDSLEVSDLRIETAEMRIEGRAEIGADRTQRSLYLLGHIESPDGDVLLPIPGERTTIKSARITVDIGAQENDIWYLEGALNDVVRDGSRLEQLTVIGSGTSSNEPGSRSISVDGVLDLKGLELPDSNVARALGAESRTTAAVHWQTGSPLRIHDFLFVGDAVETTFSGEVRQLDRSLTLSGSGSVSTEDLGVFAWPERMDMAGEASVSVVGAMDVLGGEADITLSGLVHGFRTGNPMADKVLGARIAAQADVQRTTEGTDVKNLSLLASNARVSAEGQFGEGRGASSFDIAIPDASVVVSSLPGSLELRGRLDEQPNAAWTTSLELAGPRGLWASADGTLREHASHLGIAANVPGVFGLPEPLSGGVSLDGTATQDRGGWTASLQAAGPGPVRSRIDGKFSEGGQQALVSVHGQLPLDVLDPILAPNGISGSAGFSLSTNDPPSLAALNGVLIVKGATVSIPDLSQHLSGVGVNARLIGNRLWLDGAAQGPAGGRVRLNGTTTIQSGVPFELGVALESYGIRKTDLLKSSLNGSMRLSGDLVGRKRLSGNLAIGDTLVRLDPTLISGAAPIPGIRHANEPGAVRLTRERARVRSPQPPSNAARNLGLDVTLDAPGTVRVSGRNLRATLGGKVHLSGTAANIRRDGEVRLLDGKLDLMGRRLDLTSGAAWVRGDMTPWVEFVAKGETRDITLHTIISGPVDDLEIDFISRPPLPDDEAVSTFMFGNSGNSVTPLQILEILNGTRLISDGNARTLGDVLATGNERRDDPSGTSDGLAPATTARPEQRGILTRVLSDEEGETGIEIELEINDDLSIIGRARSDGDSAIGMFFAKDY